MKNGFNKTISAIASIALLVLLIVLSTQILGLSGGVYKILQKQFGVSDVVGISEGEMDDVTDVFIDYTKGNREDLNIEVNVDGENVQMFNEREKTHMIDVKGLYGASVKIAIWLAVIAFVIFAYLLIRKQQETIYRMHKRVSIGFLFFCIALGIYFALDFNGFWTNVHLLLFTNDLWLLNPATDRMIMMFPLNFFLALSIIVLAVFILVYLLLLIFSNRGLKRIGRKKRA